MHNSKERDTENQLEISLLLVDPIKTFNQRSSPNTKTCSALNHPQSPTVSSLRSTLVSFLLVQSNRTSVASPIADSATLSAFPRNRIHLIRARITKSGKRGYRFSSGREIHPREMAIARRFGGRKRK